jgi:hypothetical protein
VGSDQNNFDLALLRNYMASTFVISSDGHGGPINNEAAYPAFLAPQLTHPHANT